jgi:hemolysin D
MTPSHTGSGTSGSDQVPSRTAPSTASLTPRHPLIELLVRYRFIWQAAWEQRHQLAGPARLADEAAFLPAALSLQTTPPHPAPRRVMWAVMSLFLIALGWAYFGQLDIVAVAPGRIVVSEGTKLVQPLEASVVKAIHVRDGDKVKAGDLLIELDPTTARADNSRVMQERNAALSELWRTQVLLATLINRGAEKRDALRKPLLHKDAADMDASTRAAMQAQLDAEWEDILAQQAKLGADIVAKQAEIDTVREQIAKLNATLPIVQKREADFEALSKQGFVSQHAGQDRTQVRIEMERDLHTYLARREETKAALAQAKQGLVAWRTDLLKTLSERHAKADLAQRQLAEDGTKAMQRERLTTLAAPTTGTVQQLAVHTTGGVVTPAQVLLVVVPDQAHVTAEVTLENKDVGFVNAAQEAEIKLETFPYTRYGTVPATVSRITADAVQDEKRGALFPATLTLAQKTIEVDGKAIGLSPGMNLTAEIKTGKRRVIDYLLSPVQSHAQESMRER